MTTDPGYGLVPLANDQMLLLNTCILGKHLGPPRWVQCTAEGDERAPAWRMSVVREPGENCASLWRRVLETVRELKCARGISHRVFIDCLTTEPPRHPMHEDLKFNVRCALWDAAGDRCPDTRVEALGALWKTLQQRPPLH